MPKRGLGIDVLTAARQRTEWAFDNFEKVYVSFSAGKDSTVMLDIAANVAREKGRRFGLLLVDLEGQYKLTIDFALKRFADLEDITDQYWVCLPIALRNAVSVYQPKWQCWDAEAEDAWIRTPPAIAITEAAQPFPFFEPGMEFEEFVPEFGEWYSEGKPTACLVGIRANESLNRYRTIASTKKQSHRGKRWTSLVTDHVYNVYPIYDWATEDIWTYHGKTRAPYNGLYDLMAKAGLTIHQQRICQPYGDDQRRGLWLYHLIEPETWSRVVARVNGANGGSLYVQEWGNINGYRKITKPPGHTWQTFAELLIRSMPPQMERHYKDKVLLFQKWWINRGYPDGIPDEAPYALEAKRLAPSWRRVCKALLRNDYWCKGLGFSQHRSDAYAKYQRMMDGRRSRWGVAEDEIAIQGSLF